MNKIYDDLFQSNVEHPFSGLNTHAYLLLREQGNVLFYNTSNAGNLQKISKLGGIKYQYLSHRHETGHSLSTIKDLFNSKLCSDIKEEPAISKVCQVDITFNERTYHSENIEVIPTPGHTEGGLCFLYQSPNNLRYLFTGDLIFQSNGEWSTVLITSDGADPKNLVSSLKILRDLKPDVVFSSASVGEASIVEVTEFEWFETIDKSIKTLS
jgi:hypothetical protein